MQSGPRLLSQGEQLCVLVHSLVHYPLSLSKTEACREQKEVEFLWFDSTWKVNANIGLPLTLSHVQLSWRLCDSHHDYDKLVSERGQQADSHLLSFHQYSK